MRALINHDVSHLLADATSGTNDDDHLAGKLALGWHALKLRFFKCPVFDVESFFLGKPNIFIDRFRAAHHRNGAVVELSGHTGLTLVLSESHHADARNQNHRWVRITHRGRMSLLVRLVVSGIVGAIFFKTCGQLGAKHIETFVLRIPIDIKRLNLGAKEVIRAGSPEFSQSWSRV